MSRVVVNEIQAKVGNDISFNDWKKKFKEDIGKADFYYNENNKNYYFKYKS